MSAPSGVLFVGLVLLMRDAVHELGGRRAVAAAIAAGGALSAAISSADLAVASAVTFVVAETADSVVYSRVRARGRTLAALASDAFGSVVDSALFLAIAFGPAAVTAYGAAQVVGKMEATVLALAAVNAINRMR